MIKQSEVKISQVINVLTFLPVTVVYLRNKETQQTLQVNINIQYDASF